MEDGFIPENLKEEISNINTGISHITFLHNVLQNAMKQSPVIHLKKEANSQIACTCSFYGCLSFRALGATYKEAKCKTSYLTFFRQSFKRTIIFDDQIPAIFYQN